MKVLITESKPIKMWLDDIEDGAVKQAIDLANLPFTFKHVAIMPDAHRGYGMPIGGVLATNGVVIPNAVGVDIGCGMCAVKTARKSITTAELKMVMSAIREVIPLGFNHHKENQYWSGFAVAPDIPVIQKQLASARKQMGTLGGGNHFIEIQQGSDGYIWIMLHSGSRNFGLKIAKEYNKIAQSLCERWYSNIPVCKGEDGLAFLPIETNEAKEYIEAMNYALMFAKNSRALMMKKVEYCLDGPTSENFNDSPIDVHHNYARWENHFGKNVIVHRKGATSAKDGEIGIIPGSQGTSSYIVKGKGCRDSFMSCSHGAGRKMGRNQARRELDLEKEIKFLNDSNIIHSIRSVTDLDEASGAYKDITVVMENQKDLVDIVVELKPLAVIKA